MNCTIKFENSDGTSAVVVLDKLCCWQQCGGKTRLHFDGGQTLEVSASFEQFTAKVYEIDARVNK